MLSGVTVAQSDMHFQKINATLNSSLSLVKELNGYMLTMDKAWGGMHVNK